MFNGGSTKYLVKEGFVNIWTNRLMSIASISVLSCCLLLMTAAILVSINVNSIMSWVEGQNVVMMYINDGVADERVEQIKTEIENCGNIRSIDFVPKESAIEKWSDLLSNEEIDVLNDLNEEGQNPFPDAYKVTLDNLKEYDITLSRLSNISDIEQINDKREYANKLEQINKMVDILGYSIVLILFAVSLFIITNTIKLTMHARKLEISIMKSVGATNWFIRIPFMIEGAVLGIIAGILSFVLSFVIYAGASDALTEISTFGIVPFQSIAKWICVMCLCSGMIIGLVSSAISISKYLKRQGGIHLD